MICTRFAPSPTGYLHLGHAFSALTAYRSATAGAFILRIEDIDRPRCRKEYEQAIYNDLAWLGLNWQQPVMRQSERRAAYEQALARLRDLNVLYDCSCNRSDIQRALSAQQEGAIDHNGPDGPIYPGTCRNGPQHPDRPMALRLNITAALRYLPDVITYDEIGGPMPKTIGVARDRLPMAIGDIVIARKDIATSYHLAVCVDDAAQGITHVTRGMDMASATIIHRVIQILLGLPAPIYHHHRLIRDEHGKRLAKRDDARAIQKYRADGISAQQVIDSLNL